MTRLSATQTSIYIAQGEFAIGNKPEHQISTILGSCVAVCLWDNQLRIGGMNHILLPDGGSSELQVRSVGAGAMEALINALLKAGAQKSSFEAKVFGGAAIVAGLSDIGKRNAEFAMNFLSMERIPVISENVGGSGARRLQFWPESGRARMKMAAASEVKVETPPKAAPASEMELF
jgi:chemotaxis protein CheD